MIFEKKWVKHYSKSNDFMKYVYGLIGSSLYAQRKERNQRLEYLARQIGVKTQILEENELGRKHFHWFALFRVLKLYGKTLEIKLVDATYEEDAPQTQEKTDNKKTP